MAIKAAILNELMEISPMLARMERVNPYTVPAGYFEGLDEHLLTMVKIKEQTPALPGIATKNPPQIPEGYFGSLAGSILSKIKAAGNQSVTDELRNLSPMLYAIDKVNVYRVPAGYFETLSDDLVNKVSAKEEAKVISLTQHKSIRWMRYAAAAVVIGMVSMVSFFIINNTGKEKDFDAVVKLGRKYAEQKKFDVTEQLNNTSDDAIANYLDKTADEADAMQMVASVDQNQLPSEEEMMSNEKLIDDLLKESENKTHN
ncbi:MAG: hypothetical protein EKK37_13685 [Sphingobacteriales bacterium]|nr:MAG: hypothetical protein EKK37_13685 [Sphingobacteriales bacterium]